MLAYLGFVMAMMFDCWSQHAESSVSQRWVGIQYSWRGCVGKRLPQLLQQFVLHQKPVLHHRCPRFL